jgi:Fe-S cluster biogenesis protein NfuA/nitrite reductase/ring-hydroxylating ferredoxin subunit
MSAVGSEAPEQLFARVQELQDQLDSSGADPSILDLAGELVSAVVAMYGAGLERILASPDGERMATALSEDPVIATLLLIHDLHPVALEQRVQDALDTVRPYMESHGGNVELLSVADGVARIHLRGSCSDCSASSVTLELAVKRALEEAAPDLAGLEVEGMAPQMSGLGLPMAEISAGVELPMVMSGPGAAPSGGEKAAHAGVGTPGPPGAPSRPPGPPAWVEVDSVATLRTGAMAGVQVGSGELLVANVEGTLLAYHDRCAGCGNPLREGSLTAGALACPSCRRTFFLPRAGRSLDDEELQLEPVPLLLEQGHVKVALAAT